MVEAAAKLQGGDREQVLTLLPRRGSRAFAMPADELWYQLIRETSAVQLVQ
jgi:hypothetical protein